MIGLKPLLAHAFGQTYTLPVPLWLFLFGAGTAVIVSFVVIGIFLDSRPPSKKRDRPAKNLGTIRQIVRIVGVFLLVLVIATGLLGKQEGYLNFSVPFVWIGFIVGFTYTVAFLGNLWEWLNPFKTLLEWLEKLIGKKLGPVEEYPKALAYYPALLTYFGLIWLELLSNNFAIVPKNLALMVIGYTFITLLCAYWYGKEAWFKYGEFFSVFFGLVSKIAPVKIVGGEVSLRKPLSGLLDDGARDFSLLLFVLFMLASTGFDGLRETVIFGRLEGLMPNFISSVPNLFETLVMALLPFALLAFYVACMTTIKRLVKTNLSTMQLAYGFAFSLVPIAIGYNIAHYFTLLLLPGQTIIKTLSDPFGYGWNLLGTAAYELNSTFLGAFAVWYIQIALIVVGHIAAVYIAHTQALKLFNVRKNALVSQYPMLILMVLYTIGSLWIIAQPIAVEGSKQKQQAEQHY